ncbi:MAG: tRNA-specific adenosine deaminase [Candidatus Vogelbacteria bacterium RIFOXYD1_FULL_46_19]|uniref:tRNA-specific adenosine deaminase n=1 Tax=Candidatus Vogelbacteria bacterium RIFOXYD1_FULL_46_19 TaxID=1802439 RepID=A0A1G2QH63_9BACT|nr:MAG: tRNA-specific adenosine deaminase [Candidatus Vogelbacteria bacterium RIFOXYD1_FULL_46_19]
MNNEHKKHMAEAIALSKESISSGGGPFGTVIVKDGKVVGRGINRVTAWNDPTAHGEVVAIREACKNLNSFQLDDCIIYTSCEPCPMCLGAIYWSRPKAIYFANTREDAASIGFDDALIYAEINVLYLNRKRPFHQIMREEAITVFQSWAEKEGKIEY